MWRYRELLPVGTDFPEVTLGEGMSPLIACPRIGRSLGLSQLLVKDESQLPTGSFKSRGLAMAITMAKRFGVTHVAIPTAGNAGGAAAAYAARDRKSVCLYARGYARCKSIRDSDGWGKGLLSQRTYQ